MQFLPFLVCSADLDILCCRSFSHHVKFSGFIFMHKISTRVVCLNGKHPVFLAGDFSSKRSKQQPEKRFLSAAAFMDIKMQRLRQVMEVSLKS